MNLSIKKFELLIPAISAFQVKTGIRLPVLLSSVHGCGKTQITKNLPGFNVQVLNLSCAGDPGELIGLPITSKVYHMDDKNLSELQFQQLEQEAKNLAASDPEGGHLVKFYGSVTQSEVTNWAQPSWLKEGLSDTEKPAIFFLDEMNRGEDIILQTMLPFTVEGRLHTHQIPLKDVIVAAINPGDSGAYTVNEFEDAALLDRFIQFAFAPSNSEYMSFIGSSDFCNAALGDLIQEHGEEDVISIADPNIDYNFNPSRRRCYTIAAFTTHLIEEDLYKDLGYEVSKAGMGNQFGERFHALNLDAQKGITLDDILKGKLPKDFKREEVERYSNAIDALGSYIADSYCLADKNNLASADFDIPKKELKNIARFFNQISADTIHGMNKQQIAERLKNRLASGKIKSSHEHGTIMSFLIHKIDEVLEAEFGRSRTLTQRVIKAGIASKR